MQSQKNKERYPVTYSIINDFRDYFNSAIVKSTTEKPVNLEQKKEMLIHVKTDDDKINAIKFITQLDADGSIQIEFKDYNKKRTSKQNSALHVYLKKLADKLNSGGYDVRTTIKSTVAFTPASVKEYMFKVVMKAMHPDKKSTTELSTTEIQEIHKHLDKMTAEKFGITVPWPSAGEPCE